MSRIHVGTSGWSYRHWVGPFYQEDLPGKDHFDFYCEHFDTVEINNTFYHLPEKKTIRGWRKRAPDSFIFSTKASRYITHMKKLKDPEDSVKKFFDVIDVLGENRGPVLFQLPPRFSYNGERFEAFLKSLPDGYRYTFEFRDRSWENDEACSLLSEHGAALCIYHLSGYTSPKEITTDFVYVRLHGPGDKYEGSYSKTDLSGWAGALTSWADMGKEVFCYFDNDQNGYAAQNALSLREMVDR